MMRHPSGPIVMLLFLVRFAQALPPPVTGPVYLQKLSHDCAESLLMNSVENIDPKNLSLALASEVGRRLKNDLLLAFTDIANDLSSTRSDPSELLANGVANLVKQRSDWFTDFQERLNRFSVFQADRVKLKDIERTTAQVQLPMFNPGPSASVIIGGQLRQRNPDVTLSLTEMERFHVAPNEVFEGYRALPIEPDGTCDIQGMRLRLLVTEHPHFDGSESYYGYFVALDTAPVASGNGVALSYLEERSPQGPRLILMRDGHTFQIYTNENENDLLLVEQRIELVATDKEMIRLSTAWMRDGRVLHPPLNYSHRDLDPDRFNQNFDWVLGSEYSFERSDKTVTKFAVYLE
jgi:hypothetical protein